LGHGADACDRLITVDRPDGCLGRRDQRDGISVCAQQDEGCGSGAWRIGKYVSAHGSRSNPPRLVSATTPTIVCHRVPGCEGSSNVTRRPSGSSPGKNRLTNVSLTMTICWDCAPSARVNIRPLRKGICSVEKYPGVTESYGTGMFRAFAGSGGLPSMLMLAEAGRRDRSRHVAV